MPFSLYLHRGPGAA